MKHVRKIIKTLDYFLITFELISNSTVKYETFKKLEKNYENSRKKNWQKIEKIFRKYHIKFRELSKL